MCYKRLANFKYCYTPPLFFYVHLIAIHHITNIINFPFLCMVTYYTICDKHVTAYFSWSMAYHTSMFFLASCWLILDHSSCNVPLPSLFSNICNCPVHGPHPHHNLGHMWHDQRKWVTCRKFSISIFLHHFLITSKCFILMQNPISGYRVMKDLLMLKTV